MSEYEFKGTQGPWKWQGEDYRGGWGWQLLVGNSGEGVMCGQEHDGPYKNLRAFMPIEPKFCNTGMGSTKDRAPGVHVREADAQAISEVPGLIEALRNLLHNYESLVYAEYEGTRFLDGQLDKTKEAHTVLTKATGKSTEGE